MVEAIKESSTEIVPEAVQPEVAVDASENKQPDALYDEGFGEEKPAEKPAKVVKPVAEKKPEAEKVDEKVDDEPAKDDNGEEQPKSAMDKLKEKHGIPTEEEAPAKAWQDMTKEEKAAELKAIMAIDAEADPEKKAEEAPVSVVMPKDAKDIPAFYKSLGLDETTIMAPHPDDPNGEVVPMTLDQFAAEYPEVTMHNAIFGEALIQSKIQSGELITRERMDTMQADINKKMAEFEFTMEVASVHPDYIKLNSDSKFKAWVQTQPSFVEKACNNGDPDDAIAVLDAYKESLAKSVKVGNDTKAIEAKKSLDKLHETTIRSASKNDDGKNKADYDVGFNEDI